MMDSQEHSFLRNLRQSRRHLGAPTLRETERPTLRCLLKSLGWRNPTVNDGARWKLSVSAVAGGGLKGNACPLGTRGQLLVQRVHRVRCPKGRPGARPDSSVWALRNWAEFRCPTSQLLGPIRRPSNDAASTEFSHTTRSRIAAWVLAVRRKREPAVSP